MAATICANGLSVVHKGSGGEANASVPDVCLTKVGKPVVPIPYGNNAKSSDLANGSTTVTADGDNSIALQDSTFSTSTGDASGDKNGVSSGTIEGEAKFVTASSNVIIEGRGVARQTDQMTMNNANTMCFGVQNPSVTVEEAAEPTFSLDVCIRYPNGKRFTNANYALTDDSGATVGSGSLDVKGQSEAVGLKPGKVKIKAEESTDNYQITSVRRENPHYVESISDDEFFDIASKGQQTFWLPARVETLSTPWGSIGQSLTSDVYFQDIVEAEIKRHFTHFHPETAYEFGKTCEAVIGSIDMPMPHTTETLLAYSMPLALEEGEMLSTLLRLAPHENTDRMLAYMRARGEGNPQTYLANYDWDSAQKHMNETLDTLLEKIKTRLTFLRDEASKLKYAYLSEQVFDKHIDTVSTYAKGLPDLISGSFNKMRNKAAALLADTSNVKVIKAADDTHSTEGDGIEAVVNTTKTIDTVEPFMNEVPGVIDNVIPIYPVRYGYANFFDEILPAQAPPTLPEMAAASGLKETGGYVLRLLREGWIYIKEEEGTADNQQVHIFRYAQTETLTGVIEKFEKYYFTNEKNAQDGLTLDTSSGATFYPFAFVTANTQKISIAYSEHEWAAEIIDKMNDDQEWRAKAMQLVDMSASDDFSDTATQDTLSSLVEEYRSKDDKWLLAEGLDKDNSYTLDALRIHNNYFLSAEGLVETLKKSHSEHKDGALVALFDPVGRQTDLSFAMSMITVQQKSEEEKTHYPTSIGTIINQMREKGAPEVIEIVEENVDTGALDSFTKEIDKKKINYKQAREPLLDLYTQFAYQDLADGTIGSLDNYLKMFFDAESANPAGEVEKLAVITQGLFESLSSNEEGQKVLVEMINSAYENDQDIADSNNMTYIVLESMKKFFLQCQDQVDWHIIVKNLPIVFGKLWAEAKSASIYGAKILGKSQNHLSAKALSKLVDSFIPIFFEKVYGIVETGGKVRVSRQYLAEALAQIINSNGRNGSKIRSATRQLSRAESMFNWSENQRNTRLNQYIQQAEIKVVFERVEFKGRISTTKANTPMDFVGMLGDGVMAGASWYFNWQTLYDVYAQGEFDSADPLSNTFYMYEDMKIMGAISAVLVDTAAVARTGLIYSNQYLLQAGTTNLAQRVLPKTTKILNTLALWAERKVFARLIAGANVAMAFVSLSDAYESHQDGNTGEMLGHLTMATGSALLAGGAFYTFSSLGWAMAFGFFAFAIVVIGGVLVWLYSKSQFERLLHNCFWGKNELYGFWRAYKGGEHSIPARLAIYRENVENPIIKTAYQIELQEFMNLLIKPSVEVHEDNAPFNSISKYQYTFTLPNFVLNVSNIVASIHKKVINPYQQKPLAYNYEYNEQATKAFSKAIALAMNEPASHTFNNGTLTVTFEVEMEEDCVLQWYYQPSPELTVPQRSLILDGGISKTYLGMRNNDYID
ncbi:PAAR-like domain-containing protein [Vibrio hyugaensis]|uniref:PAAR-like domain-containing protein n=1 Tax=Vibrio hyugaensis TaxID=1534743 RepID=UPI000CE3EB71|nr:PAAR-like domain-containing protein [Vibrio hyugaensis]